MFGYIKPFKPEMKIKDFDEYRSIYCGFCKLLGKTYGSFYRLTLSYDFTFAAVLSISLNENKTKCATCKCMLHPFKKRKCASLETVDVLPSSAILLLYYKLLDDKYDNSFFGKILAKSGLLFMTGARNKAKKDYPLLDETFSTTITTQNKIEETKNLSINAYANPSAIALKELFSYLSDDDKTKTILKELGFLIGEYVYLADALDDYIIDKKKGKFNPFISPTNDNLSLTQIFDNSISSINMVIGKIIDVYEFLDIIHYKPILDNIIYFGLQNTLFLIRKNRLNETECSHE